MREEGGEGEGRLGAVADSTAALPKAAPTGLCWDHLRGHHVQVAARGALCRRVGRACVGRWCLDAEGVCLHSGALGCAPAEGPAHQRRGRSASKAWGSASASMLRAWGASAGAGASMPRGWHPRVRVFAAWMPGPVPRCSAVGGPPRPVAFWHCFGLQLVGARSPERPVAAVEPMHIAGEGVCRSHSLQPSILTAGHDALPAPPPPYGDL